MSREPSRAVLVVNPLQALPLSQNVLLFSLIMLTDQLHYICFPISCSLEVDVSHLGVHSPLWAQTSSNPLQNVSLFSHYSHWPTPSHLFPYIMFTGSWPQLSWSPQPSVGQNVQQSLTGCITTQSYYGHWPTPLQLCSYNMFTRSTSVISESIALF